MDNKTNKPSYWELLLIVLFILSIFAATKTYDVYYRTNPELQEEVVYVSSIDNL